MKCTPAVHRYKPLGKILFCERCADVQPLLLAEEYDETPQPAAPRPQNVPRGIAEQSEPEPESIEELEDIANKLRAAVGIRRESPEQLPLGQRRVLDDDDLVDLSNRQTTPRVGVNEGFEGSPYDEDLPNPGL